MSGDHTNQTDVPITADAPAVYAKRGGLTGLVAGNPDIMNSIHNMHDGVVMELVKLRMAQDRTNQLLEWLGQVIAAQSTTTQGSHE